MDARVAIVTGGGTGIGAASARLLVANGLRVVLVGRRRGPLEALAAELGEGRWTTGNVIHVDGGQVLGLPASAGG